ncbi:HAD-IA family hydrolase [Aquabacterium sp. A7-Y]|uniref:HAD-IA family hydrolase n=1 Tax=Aquabacterium sp. A7-Y TaxID=1349605 RepID=UPI00223CB379|nr:HAD-IA family hydrolase [Aquabacterium sp. A7-Y]MCW7538617.1 HAD-IA family hydrolase [Aquabacterium sp. A7-Y]
MSRAASPGLRALVWDVDGTLAETERDGHRVAFNLAFKEFGLPWRWDSVTYGRLLQVTGGRERLLHDFASRPGLPADAGERERLAAELHRRKNAIYATLLESRGIALRPGVRELIEAGCAEGVAQAIATTTSRANVEALLRHGLGADWRQRFAAVVCAEDAPAKKPHPQAYLLALQQLGCAAHEAIAIEDSPNGLAAARGAGIATVVTRSAYFARQPFDGALAVCEDLCTPQPVSLDRLRGWLQRGPAITGGAAQAPARRC